MSELRTIVVHVDEAAHCPARLAVAERLARAHDAELIGTFVMPPLLLPVYMPGEITPGLIELIEAQRQSARQQAEAHFAMLKRTMPAAIWRVIDTENEGLSSDMVAALARAARTADLAVVGQAGPGEVDSNAPGVVPQELVMTCGRPVLVVPYAGRFATLGERAIVAWSDTREAARALSDALPMLRKAKQVTVLQVQEAAASDAAEQGRARGALKGVVHWLERHGVAATAVLEPHNDSISPANLLLSRAADRDADLLVMGAYGHSRLRELVLGGMTREILSSMTVPVLLSH